MLQARLADGRAKEAEQKLQGKCKVKSADYANVIVMMLCVFCSVLQAELLQSQGEVRMLLDRVSESSRDRAERVSS